MAEQPDGHAQLCARAPLSKAKGRGRALHIASLENCEESSAPQPGTCQQNDKWAKNIAILVGASAFGRRVAPKLSQIGPSMICTVSASLAFMALALIAPAHCQSVALVSRNISATIPSVPQIFPSFNQGQPCGSRPLTKRTQFRSLCLFSRLKGFGDHGVSLELVAGGAAKKSDKYIGA